MNPKKKPDYDAKKILQEMVDAAAIEYAKKKTLQAVADELGLNLIKIRKLLITAGVWVRGNSHDREEASCHAYDNDLVYRSATADEVLRLKNDGKSIADIMAITGLSKSSVNSYLPYTRTPYKAEEVSANADRIRKYRERKAAVENLKTKGGTEAFLSAITAFQDYPFYTDKGVKYAYKILDGTLVINRGRLSIPVSAVEAVYSKARGYTLTDFRKIMEAERSPAYEMVYICPVLERLEVFADSE